MCIIFLVIGFSGLLGATVSHGCFSILGEAMTQRLRVAILTSIFRGSVYNAVDVRFIIRSLMGRIP